MEIDVEEVKKLIKERFRNNKKWFAEEIGIDYSYLLLILKGKKKPTSAKFIKLLKQYCKKNKLDYNSYIFL